MTNPIIGRTVPVYLNDNQPPEDCAVLACELATVGGSPCYVLLVTDGTTLRTVDAPIARIARLLPGAPPAESAPTIPPGDCRTCALLGVYGACEATDGRADARRWRAAADSADLHGGAAVLPTCPTYRSRS